MKPDINALIGQITSIITQVIGIGILILILAVIAAKFGFTQRIVPVTQAYELMLICAGWRLYMGWRIT